MKHSRNYILSVYTVFIIELLTLICSMAFCERFLGFNTLSMGELQSNGDPILIVAIFFILIDCVIEWRWIDKNKGKIIVILLYIFTISCENLIYGMMLALLDCMFKDVGWNNIIQYTFWITVVVFISITIWGFLTKRKDYNHPILNYCFIGSVVVGIFNIFWGWSWLNIILDIVDIIIVSLFIYFDTIKIKQHAKRVITFSKKVKFLNVLKDASGIYLDFLVIWSSLFDLMAESED
ncbi:Bax inhibitor-1 family protein [Ligilactobacillus aviarius]|uniref:Bax inhibitor-1 family protein n=1 Tax=Ligilactobacillus aviarius TaxID=1606 RepID=UPI0024B9333E|nr:Bax inhibitor-1 family protein [Ligilactobacillus aviarius]